MFKEDVLKAVGEGGAEGEDGVRERAPGFLQTTDRSSQKRARKL